jgi:hypothetical protein
LRVEDVLLRERVAYVEGKSGTRIVAIGVEAQRRLALWLAVRDRLLKGQDDHGLVFFNSRLRRWTPNALQAWTRRLCRDAGIPHRHPHQFRHTAATAAALTGNILFVTQQLGHASVETSRKYIGLSAGALLDGHQRTGLLDQVTQIVPLAGPRLLQPAALRPCNLKNVAHPGEANGRSVLTAGAVREIKRRLATGEKQATLAREYGVSHVAIGKIARGRTWTHIAADESAMSSH